MGRLTKAEMVEEMRWKYAGGPLPAYRARRRARVAAWGCAARFVVGLVFCACVILLVKWLLF